MVVLLNEAGLMSSTGMGPVPLSWVDIDAWLRVTDQKLSLWEVHTLKTMSEIYVSERLSATDPNSVAPWVKPADVEEIDREKVSSALLNFLRDFKKNRIPK